MAAVPHLSFPVRLAADGHLAEVEQDSIDDKAECVEVVLLTRPGERSSLPNFGTPDLAFQQRPLDLGQVVGQVAEWEPRARLLAEEDPDTIGETVARVSMRVEGA